MPISHSFSFATRGRDSRRRRRTQKKENGVGRAGAAESYFTWQDLRHGSRSASNVTTTGLSHEDECMLIEGKKGQAGTQTCQWAATVVSQLTEMIT